MPDNAEAAKTFLSHNSRDKPEVEVIKCLLERGDPQNGKRPIPCWFDRDDLRSQGTWISQLEDAVAACGAAVVFYGPDGHGPVHKYEIDLLLKRTMYEKGRDAIRLVLVLLPGAPEDAIHGFISLHMWCDFRKGLNDAAALQRLRAFILGEAPTSGPGEDPLVPKPAIEPYRGLEVFEGKHASYFFGRDNEIKEFCSRLQEWPFTAVIGASGSGKSSIVRAGLQTDRAKKERPTLAYTTTITVRPGTNPIHSLAEQVAASQSELSANERLKFIDGLEVRFRSHPDALLNTLTSLFIRDDQHILLVIDQFEELFTHSSENSSGLELPKNDIQQSQFVDLLAAVAKSQLDRLRIVITLRADFFDRCLSIPTLKYLVGNRTLLLGNLSDDALRTVIEAPAFKVGAYFEKGLVARILKDVENQNGSLPLLQHALKELWEQRRFGFLTDDAYDETGGVEGALKKRANATLQNLSEDQREIAKNVFLRLTTLGNGVSDTRRRVRKSELYPEKTDPRTIDVVLKELSSQANRLIVTNDDGTVEVTHEALIQRWDTLKGWLAENRNDKRIHDALLDATEKWVAAGRDVELLLTGRRLADAKNLVQERPLWLSSDEMALVRASQAALITQQTHRKMLLGTLVAVAFLAVGVSVYAAFSQIRARTEERFRAAIETITQGNGTVAVDTSQGRLNYIVTFAAPPAADTEKRERFVPEAEQKAHFLKTGYTLDWSVYLEATMPNPERPASVTKSIAAPTLEAVKDIPQPHLIIQYDANAALQTIAALSNLRQLTLANTQFDQANLRWLGNLPNLESLDLSNTSVSDEGAALLAKLTSLKTLVLANTRIGDQGLAQLNQLVHLRKLDLQGTRVSATAFRDLRKARPAVETTLHRLAVLGKDASRAFSNLMVDDDFELVSINVGGEATDSDMKVLASCKRLRTINFNFANITDTGLAHLSGHQQLRELVFESHKGSITDEGYRHLASLPILEILDLGELGKTISDQGLYHFQGHAGLRKFRLSGGGESRITASSLAAFAACKNIEEIDLQYLKLAGATHHLSQLHRMRRLSLRSCDQTDADVAALAGLQNLESLDLSTNWDLTDQCLPHLKSLPKLQWLFARGTKVTLGGLVQSKLFPSRGFLDQVNMVAEVGVNLANEPVRIDYAGFTDDEVAKLTQFQTLRELWLSHSERLTDETLRHAARLPHLRSLLLSKVQFTDAGLLHLRGLTNLEWLIIEGNQNITDDGLANLAGLSKLERLALSGDRLDGAGLRHLHGLKQLKEIDLGYQSLFSEKDVDDLQSALPRIKISWTKPEAGTWNGRAWKLATHRLDSVRDGKRAVNFASEACRLTENKNPEFLSTLAAAYAESGDFETAKKWQKQAIELAPADQRNEYEARLQLYDRGVPFRDN